MTNRQSNIIFYSVISIIIYALIINFAYPEFFENFSKSKDELAIQEAMDNGEHKNALLIYQKITEEKINNNTSYYTHSPSPSPPPPPSESIKLVNFGSKIHLYDSNHSLATKTDQNIIMIIIIIIVYTSYAKKRREEKSTIGTRAVVDHWHFVVVVLVLVLLL